MKNKAAWLILAITVALLVGVLLAPASDSKPLVNSDTVPGTQEFHETPDGYVPVK